MKRSRVAALVFGGILAAIAIANVPPIAKRINDALGLTPDAPQVAVAPPAAEPDAAVEAASPGADSTGNRPPSSAEQANAEETPAQIASIPAERMGENAAVPSINVPTFGLLRVEPDGSTVIAGQAGPNAEIEVLAGADRIASARAAANGDFVAVLDVPLSPGDYEIVLRSTEESGSIAMSEETAIVSVPEKGKESELLALVEQPGQPSRLINTPEPVDATISVDGETQQPEQAAAGGAEADRQSGEGEDMAAVAGSAGEGATSPTADGAALSEGDAQATAGASGSQGQTEVASLPDNAANQSEASEQVAPGDVLIEAVEIDGDAVFVAGSAPAGAQIRVYANDILLGDTNASPGGRFLVQANRDLPVGDYIMRADQIDRATAEVTARAAVPFSRGEGERLAAVAVDASPPPDAETSETADARVQGAGSGSGDTGTAVSAGTGEPQVDPGTAPGQPTETALSNDAPAAADDDGEAASTGSDIAAVSPQPQATAPDAIDKRPIGTTRLQMTNSSVIIRRGDTLWQISRRVYGRGIRYTTIYLANQTQIADPDRIWPGQVFALPENEEPESQGETSVN